MSVELQVIRASEFVRLGADQCLDLEASKAALRVLAMACRKRGHTCALVDLRTLPVPEKPRYTTAEIAALVCVFRDAGFTRQQRLAILYRQDVHGGIRSFAFIGRIRGLQVRAVNDYEEAIQWLSCEPGRSGDRAVRGVQVPIKQKRPEPKHLVVKDGSQRPVRRTTGRH